MPSPPPLCACPACLLLHLHLLQDLQHIYPVLEPGQAKEFRGAMQEWVRELGAAGQLSPEAAKYFVTAYQGNNAHRTMLMLLELW